MTGCRRTYEDRSPLICSGPEYALPCSVLLSLAGFIGILVLLLSCACTTAFAQPLSGQAAKNFSSTLKGVKAENFGTLRLLEKKSLKGAYEKNVQAVALLEKDARKKTWRQPWENLRDEFVSIAISSPGTDLAAEAIYKAAACQKALAAYSRQNKDWRLACSMFEALYAASPKSRLADDSLLACADIQARFLRDTRQALKYLDLHAKKYGKSDTAKEAEALRKTLAGASPKKEAGKEGKEDKAAKETATKETAGKDSPAKKRPVQIRHASGRPYSVTIDAGHGGHDPGTVHNGILERDITLDIALRLGRQLQQYGITVYYTRTKDTFVSLPQRSALANRTGSDLFVSIHVNANPSQAARGLEVYYLDTAATCSVNVADRENGKHKKVSAARVSAKQQATAGRMARSRKLAQMVTAGLDTSISGNGYAIEKNSVRKAPFFVLATTSMPSILAEVGYCSNKEDAALLKKAAYRQSLSDGLSDGIVAFFRHNTKNSGYVAENSVRNGVNGGKKKAAR